MRRMPEGALAQTLLLILAYSAAGTLHARERLPEVPAPPLGNAQWVARSMRVNGLPMTVQSFDTRMTVDELLHHYARWARGRFDESFRTRRGDWHVLALRSRGHLITIQARPNGSGTHGTIAASSLLDKAERNIASRFPVPPSLRIVNLQQYEDFGVDAEHISLLGARAPHVEAAAMAALLVREGWQLTRDQRAHRVPRGFVLEAQKGAQHASIVVFPDRTRNAHTAAIVIWRKS